MSHGLTCPRITAAGQDNLQAPFWSSDEPKRLWLERPERLCVCSLNQSGEESRKSSESWCQRRRKWAASAERIRGRWELMSWGNPIMHLSGNQNAMRQKSKKVFLCRLAYKYKSYSQTEKTEFDQWNRTKEKFRIQGSSQILSGTLCVCVFVYCLNCWTVNIFNVANAKINLKNGIKIQFKVNLNCLIY